MMSNTDKAILSFANVEQLKAVAATLGKETNTPINKMISALAKLQGMNQKSYKDSIQAQGGVHEINIELPDVFQGYENKIKSKIRIANQVTLGFEGYETRLYEPEHAELVLVEYADGSPYVRAWADRYQEDITHSIEFGQAKSGEKVLIPDIDWNSDAFEYEIDGFIIPSSTWEQELCDVRIVDRENEIDELERMIGETHSYLGSNPNAEENRRLMQEDLETLRASDEDYVLGFYSTNGFMTPEQNREAFVAKVEELLEAAKSQVQDKVVVRAKAVVSEDELDSDDKNVAGVYVVEGLREKGVQIGHEANAALDAFHDSIPVAVLDDFTFEVFNADMSTELEESESIESGEYYNYGIDAEFVYKE